jgi:NADH-ubiquinone oxidoreductase chain 5
MNSFMVASYNLFVKSIDKGILEFLGPLGLSKFFNSASIRASNSQSGLIYHYAFIFLVGLLIVLTFFAFNLSWLYLIESSLIFVILVGVIILSVFN